ncbi:hypothetical protein PLAN_160032 [Planktothrix rubescens CCAP 1459/22]|uniref:Uncharacterized protein n=1 Tax=Planktothrix rubescens CCAP 1459/22 TaxID=329571 RepID=A0A6J7ZJ94_PLARU|nr:hypothetical protein PLAN_160032 [Planktothrix rubescens NIVA-CYA 18]CAD0227479.1 conserved hypothetical protein [Planktothrix agardhii]
MFRIFWIFEIRIDGTYASPVKVSGSQAISPERYLGSFGFCAI